MYDYKIIKRYLYLGIRVVKTSNMHKLGECEEKNALTIIIKVKKATYTGIIK